MSFSADAIKCAKGYEPYEHLGKEKCRSKCESGERNAEGTCVSPVKEKACPPSQHLSGSECVDRCRAQSNQVFDADSKSCVCSTGFERIEGDCLVLCPAGTKRHLKDCALIPVETRAISATTIGVVAAAATVLSFIGAAVWADIARANKIEKALQNMGKQQ